MAPATSGAKVERTELGVLKETELPAGLAVNVH
jgi:hypothetical protein